MLSSTPKAVTATTMRDFRSNLKSYADNVADHDQTVILNRPKKQNVVLISEREYNSLRETNYLLSTEANRNDLLQALAESKEIEKRL